VGGVWCGWNLVSQIFLEISKKEISKNFFLRNFFEISKEIS
jgi:hypothetical protein